MSKGVRHDRSAARTAAARRADDSERGRLFTWWRLYLALLFIGSLLWHALALRRLAGGPLLTQLSADADIYWRWASELRSGTWLPKAPFFLAPLYPYWLAAVRTVVGDSIARVLCVQAVLGAGSVTLLADATKRLAAPRAGAVVGVMLAGYGVAVAFDLLILSESLLLFLGSLTLWLIVRRRAARPVWIGALIGLMGLGRPTFLLLLVPIAGYLVARNQSHWGRTLASVVAIPFALVTLTAWHHWRVDGAWTPITYSGGYNLYVGNGPLATGTYVPFADANGTPWQAGQVSAGGTQGDGRAFLEQARGLHLTASGSSRYWLVATANQLQSHPGAVARLFVRKLGFLFNHRELSQQIDTAAYARAIGPIGWPLGWAFALFGIWGLIGLSVAWRQRLGATALFVSAWLLTLVLGFAAVFVVDRYRIHLIPPLALLTGIGIEQVLTAWAARRWRAMGTSALVGGAAASIVFAPLIPDDPAHAQWSYDTTMGEAWLAKGDARRALPFYLHAIELERSSALPGANTMAGRFARAGVYEDAGSTYSALGDEQHALECLALAVRLAPEAASTRAHYADQLALAGNWDEARTQYRALGVGLQDVAERLTQQAAEDEQRGDQASTRRFLRAAAGLLPSFEPAVIPLVRLEILAGSFEAAASELQAAETGGMDVNVVRAHRAWIRAAQGDTTGARLILGTMPFRARAGDPRVSATFELMRQSTHWNGALSPGS